MEISKHSTKAYISAHDITVVIEAREEVMQLLTRWTLNGGAVKFVMVEPKEDDNALRPLPTERIENMASTIDRAFYRYGMDEDNA